MIQRQQTLWLLLCTFSAALTFKFPFATGKIMVNGLETDKVLNGTSNILLLILTTATVALSATIIFMYKKRKQQMQLCWLGILVSLGLIAFYVFEYKKLDKSTLAFAAVLPVIVLLSYFMAFRNIRKDEKLVKSLDKLR